VNAAYDPYQVPEAPGGGSRFFLASTPAGWGTAPSENVAGVYRALLADRQREAAGFTPAPVEVQLKQVSLVGGDYVLEDRSVVARMPSFESRRPGQRWRKLEGGALLDSFYVGGDAFTKAPDLEVWEAMRDTADAHLLTGKALRQLCDWTAVLVCLRAGVAIKDSELPYVQSFIREAAG
jgi:hypothetical protein